MGRQKYAVIECHTCRTEEPTIIKGTVECKTPEAFIKQEIILAEKNGWRVEKHEEKRNHEPTKGHLCEIEMPKGSNIMSAGSPDREHIYVWAEVDSDVKEMETRLLFVYGTGHPLADPLEYIKSKKKTNTNILPKHFLGTVFIDNSQAGKSYVPVDTLVFHVYVVNYND